MNAGLIVIILLLVLSILGIPIYLALGIGTLVALNMADMPFIVLPQKLFAGMNSSSLLAIPFFMLAGNIMSRSITGKLIDVSNALIGWIKGSLRLLPYWHLRCSVRFPVPVLQRHLRLAAQPFLP